MHVKVQSVSEMSEAERQRMCEDLTWIREETSTQWMEDHWWITFKNNAITLGFLVRKMAEPIVASDDLAPATILGSQ